jgi:hypothetical protein
MFFDPIYKRTPVRFSGSKNIYLIFLLKNKVHDLWKKTGFFKETPSLIEGVFSFQKPGIETVKLI